MIRSLHTPSEALHEAAEQPRRAAVIDLGSNSWRLVVFSYSSNAWWRRTDELQEPVRIAAGMATTDRISEVALKRGLRTLDLFASYCRASGIAPRDVDAVATSAVRDAANGDDLVAAGRAATGFDIRVLSWEEEARYGYLAAVNSTTLETGAVLDIGGGSLQLVTVRDRRAETAASWPLGAVRVTERLLLGSGPVSRKELKRVRADVRRQLRDASGATGVGSRMVGVGGAVRCLAAAAQRAEGVPTPGVQGYLLQTEALGGLVEQLAGLRVDERAAVPGIKAARADIILAAAVVVHTVLEEAGMDRLEVTQSGLREGVFFARRLLPGDSPLLPDVRRAGIRNLAVQYQADLAHAEHVADLSLQMYESLVGSGDIAALPGERDLLQAAAMLHEVGMAVDYDGHHEHARYLIARAGLPGFSPRELELISLIARYHGKGSPRAEDCAGLVGRDDLELVRRCSVILRLADHLERGHDQVVSEARLAPQGGRVELHLRVVGDPTLPRWSVTRGGMDEAFRRTFGRPLAVA
jgi:exopolyphosphatase / guanosine-5'-triphosphate,3'-diphosphate pyrophosphatase